MNLNEEKNLFEKMKTKLFSAVVCDMLDDLGYRHQAMRENIRPLELDMVLVGRARTVLAADIYYTPEHPYEMEIEAMDSIQQDEIVVASTNQSIRTGLWGELLSTAARMRGATGAVIDGLIRDSRQIIDMQFPVFCTGFTPMDSKGRSLVIDYNCPVEVGGVLVHPGDVIFADRDGIVVIPKDALEQVVEMAFKKLESENKTRNDLLQGKLLKDVYDKYGVL